MSDCKDHVKYLGVLLDSNLSWKFRIDNVALKVSRTVGVAVRLRHLVPPTTLLNIYQSLISPYLTYGLAAWGQPAKNPFTKKLSSYKNESSIWCNFLNPEHMQCNYLFPQTFYPSKCYMLKMYPLLCLTSPAWMLRLTFVISLLKLIQSISMRPGSLGLEIIMSKLQDWKKSRFFFQFWS